jgi:hypothetical protein
VTIPAGLRSQTGVMSAEYTQLLLPKLTDEQLATLMSYGTTEQTSVGQILAAAGDLSYGLDGRAGGRRRVFRHARGTPSRPSHARAP